MNSDIYDDLSWRELIFQESDTDGIKRLLSEAPATLYCGFDPTADSLHVGSLVPLLVLRRFQLAGHRPLVLLGGATGLIGDPSGKSAERNLNDKEVVDGYVERFRGQVSQFLDFSAKETGARIVNNYDWIGSLSTIGYLREVGKHFTVNWMLAKDSVQSRLGREAGGISYTEFSYMILQAFDFYHLAKTHGCRLQIGGSDQWGNMTAGIDLIRKKLSTQAYVQTLPLVTTAEGKKFGKTEAGAIWLDPKRTSPYAFYQFWLNVDDRDAVRYLKFFTFVSREEIDALAQSHAERPDQRHAHRRLAQEVTLLLHGQTELDKVLRASEALFGAGELTETDPETLEAAVASAPSVSFPALDAVPDLLQVLVDVGLMSSRSEARKAITSGGVYINNVRLAQPDHRLTTNDLLHGRLIILRKGKKNYALVRIQA